MPWNLKKLLDLKISWDLKKSSISKTQVSQNADIVDTLEIVEIVDNARTWQVMIFQIQVGSGSELKSRVSLWVK